MYRLFYKKFTIIYYRSRKYSITPIKYEFFQKSENLQFVDIGLRSEPPLAEMINIRIDELKAYLNSTDWYVIRYADTGQAIPVDVRVDRQEARAEIDALREELGVVGSVRKIRNFPYTTP